MRRTKSVLRQTLREVGPEILEIVLAALHKVIGETVKDRLTRAIMIGTLSAVGSYFGEHPETTEQIKQSVEQVTQSAKVEPP